MNDFSINQNHAPQTIGEVLHGYLAGGMDALAKGFREVFGALAAGNMKDIEKAEGIEDAEGVKDAAEEKGGRDE